MVEIYIESIAFWLVLNSMRFFPFIGLLAGFKWKEIGFLFC
jgi:hypothetical protein